MRTYRLVSKACRLQRAREMVGRGFRPAQGGAKTRLVAFIVCYGAALGAPLSTSANEVRSANSLQTSSALGFTVIIPAILQIQENQHPATLTSTASPVSRISAIQNIVLLSTLRKGFCMNLQLTNLQLVDWHVTVSGSAGTSIEPAGGGYRLCMARAGRYKLALQHSFSPSTKHDGASTAATEISWPISLSLSNP